MGGYSYSSFNIKVAFLVCLKEATIVMSEMHPDHDLAAFVQIFICTRNLCN